MPIGNAETKKKKKNNGRAECIFYATQIVEKGARLCAFIKCTATMVQLAQTPVVHFCRLALKCQHGRGIIDPTKPPQNYTPYSPPIGLHQSMHEHDTPSVVIAHIYFLWVAVCTLGIIIAICIATHKKSHAGLKQLILHGLNTEIESYA